MAIRASRLGGLFFCCGSFVACNLIDFKVSQNRNAILCEEAKDGGASNEQFRTEAERNED